MLIGRMTLVLAVTSVAAASAPAFAQGSLADQMAVCARISKKDARMECYDSVAQAASSGGGTSSSSSFGASSIRTPPPAPAAPVAAGAVAGAAVGAAAATPSFGSEQVKAAAPVAAAAPRPKSDNEIDIAVVSSRDNGLAMWQFNLSDGAVWRMTERNTTFRPPAPNEVVTIRKGALGGYLMEVGSQGSVRVERVR